MCSNMSSVTHNTNTTALVDATCKVDASRNTYNNFQHLWHMNCNKQAPVSYKRSRELEEGSPYPFNGTPQCVQGRVQGSSMAP